MCSGARRRRRPSVDNHKMSAIASIICLAGSFLIVGFAVVIALMVAGVPV